MYRLCVLVFQPGAGPGRGVWFPKEGCLALRLLLSLEVGAPFLQEERTAMGLLS